MKNIKNVFLNDLRKMRKNVIAIIVILGICILPSLYAWFNIAAVWDPYKNTGNIPVAVVNLDKGSNLNGLELHVGKQVESDLKGNKNIDWSFISHKKAMDGIDKGKYYAVVEIPTDFSDNIISFTTDKLTRPRIKYYVNEKKNGIAPKITDTAIKTIQAEVNASFIKTTATYISNIIKVGTENAPITKDTLKENINKTLDDTVISLKSLNSNIQAFKGNLKSLSALFNASANLSNSVSASVEHQKNFMNGKLREFQSVRKELDGKINENTGNLNLILDKVQAIMTDSIERLSSLSDNSKNAANIFHDLNNSIGSSINALDASSASIENTIAGINNFKSQINSINISDNFINLLNKAISNPEELGNFISSPVKIEEHKVFPVKNYGSAMCPFYTTLAIWVGGIIMVAILKTKVSEDKNIQNLTLRQAYLGRFGIFCAIGLVQSAIISLGDLFFLQIQCKNPFIFFMTCLVTSLVFTLIIYTLTVSFGNIGKAMAVIWLVIQVAGSGGTFPIEVLPYAFQISSYFMPFTFTCNAMRESIAGVYVHDYINDMIKLTAFIPISLIMGLILRNPLYRLNEFFEKRMKDTKFMD